MADDIQTAPIPAEGAIEASAGNEPVSLEAGFDQAPSQNAGTLAQSAIPGTPIQHAAERINLLDQSGDLVSVDPSELSTALQNGYTQPSADDIHKYAQEQKYGTAGQMAITGAEGALKGALGPVGTGIERALGVKAEDIRGREETNPGIHTAAELGTFGATALLGVGEAGLLAKAGEAVGAATGLAQGTRIAQIGEDAVKAAFEGALYQGGEEIHKAFLQDPNQTAETAISDIGMATVLTGMFGGAVGAALRKSAPAVTEEAGHFVSGVDRAAVEAGDVRASIAASDLIKPSIKEKMIEAFDVGKRKPDYSATSTAAKEIGQPMLPGMGSSDKLVEQGVDSLMKSRYTFSGRRVGEMYDSAWSGATDAIEKASTAGDIGSKAEIGQTLQDSLTKTVREKYAPIKAVYDQLEASHSLIPVGEDVSAMLAKDLRGLKEVSVTPGSKSGQLARAVLEDLKNVKTVDDIAVIKKNYLRSVDPDLKHISGIISDRLASVEEAAVDKFAKSIPKNDELGAHIASLVDQKKAVTPAYKEYIKSLSSLSETLGKGRIHGTEDALNFLNNRLTPEEVAGRLFNKKDSQFLKTFSKDFPDEYKIARDYQRSLLQDASKTGDKLDPKKFIKKFNALEPEIQKAMYSPHEIVKIKAADQYLNNFPKNYNGSNTSHQIAYHDAFTSPLKWASAQARDAGIEGAIRLADRTAQGKQAVELANATVSGEKTAAKSIKAIFNKTDLPTNVIPLISQRLKMDKLVTQYAADPTKMLAMNDNNNSVPAYSTAMAASAARVVNYLSSLKPQTAPVNPLDGKRTPSPTEKAKYDRALDIAQQPMVVLSHLKDSRLTPDDINALKTMYPSLYNNLTQKLTAGVVEAVQKDKPIPYGVRQGLSLFLGQPMDSTLTPQSILRAQQAAVQAKAPYSGEAQEQGPPKSTNKLDKLPNAAMTPSQARESARANGRHAR